MEKMIILIFIFLLLKYPPILCHVIENNCLWRTQHSEFYDEEMQIDCAFTLYIKLKQVEKGVFINVPDSPLPPTKYVFGLILDYAIEEINRNHHLLPNMSLGYYLFTTLCDFGPFFKIQDVSIKTVTGSFPNYTCQKTFCHVIISGELWITAARFAPYMQIYNVPQLTYGSFHPTLSDRDRFPNLYQVAKKDTSLNLAMVSLMIHFSWNWVGLVISDDDQGIQFLSELREEMQRHEICSAFVNIVPVNKQLSMSRAEIYYKQIVTSSANVVIVYGDMTSTLGESIKMWSYLGTQKIWITTTQWNGVTSKSASFLDQLHRVFTFSQHHGEITGLKRYIQMLNSSKYLEEFSQEKLGWMYFNCSVSQSEWKILHNSSHNVSVEWLTWHTVDVALSEESYNLYNAAYVVAHSLHELLLQQVDIQVMDNNGELQSDCMKLSHLLKTIQFTNPLGDLVDMNPKGNLDTEHGIFNLWNLPQGLQVKGKIGHFSPCLPQDQQLKLAEDMIEWTIGRRQIPSSVCSVACSPGFRKSHQEGKAACCFDCIPCAENEISNETDREHCLKCPDDQYPNFEKTHCLQRTVSFLAYEDPLGMTLACLALGFSSLSAVILWVFVKHHDTPMVKANNRALSYILLISLTFCFLCSLLFIGHPNTATCILQQTTFGVVFTVAVSSILAKTVTVVLAFKLTAPGRKTRWLLVSGAPNFIIPICTLIQIILCGVWLGTSPPFIETDSQSEHGHIIIVCNKGSVTAFYCVLGYLGSLALVSFTLAFLARNLPDTFNEAKFLTFSMLVFCSVWVTFLPVYHSTNGKAMVAVEVFSILASSAGLLGCIFVPKCYLLLLRKDKNSLLKYRDRTLS